MIWKRFALAGDCLAERFAEGAQRVVSVFVTFVIACGPVFLPRSPRDLIAVAKRMPGLKGKIPGAPHGTRGLRDRLGRPFV